MDNNIQKPHEISISFPDGSNYMTAVMSEFEYRIFNRLRKEENLQMYPAYIKMLKVMKSINN